MINNEKQILRKCLQYFYINISFYIFIISYSFCICDEDRNTDFD